jgi:hypothetical protein
LSSAVASFSLRAGRHEELLTLPGEVAVPMVA